MTQKERKMGEREGGERLTLQRKKSASLNDTVGGAKC